LTIKKEEDADSYKVLISKIELKNKKETMDKYKKFKNLELRRSRSIDKAEKKDMVLKINDYS